MFFDDLSIKKVILHSYVKLPDGNSWTFLYLYVYTHYKIVSYILEIYSEIVSYTHS